MARPPTPWFKFFAGEFLEDEKVKVLSLEERGALVTLWSMMWVNGIRRGSLFLTPKTPIPDSEIAHALRLSEGDWMKLKLKFTEELELLKVGGKRELYSKRLRNYKTKWELYGGQRDSKKKPKRNQNDKNLTTEVESEVEVEVEVEKTLKPLCPDFLQRAEKLKTLILQNNGRAKITPKQIEEWGDVVRLMVERDKRTLEEIDALIEFSQGEEFEKIIILSMGKVRKHFDRLTLKMKQGEKKRSQPWEDEIK